MTNIFKKRHKKNMKECFLQVNLVLTNRLKADPYSKTIFQIRKGA